MYGQIRVSQLRLEVKSIIKSVWNLFFSHCYLPPSCFHCLLHYQNQYKCQEHNGILKGGTHNHGSHGFHKSQYNAADKGSDNASQSSHGSPTMKDLVPYTAPTVGMHIIEGHQTGSGDSGNGSSQTVCSGIHQLRFEYRRPGSPVLCWGSGAKSAFLYWYTLRKQTAGWLPPEESQSSAPWEGLSLWLPAARLFSENILWAVL